MASTATKRAQTVHPGQETPSRKEQENAGLITLRRWMRRLNDPKDMEVVGIVGLLLLTFEAVLCNLILRKVAYTEIDWEAYMSQVSAFRSGERDYLKIRGGTGPVVYPAGYIYLYTALQDLTGGEVPAAQVWFLGFYLLNLAIVLGVYAQAMIVPPWALALLCISKRLHSIFLLRLFNDGPAMALAFASVLLFHRGRWLLGMLVFSAAVSVKMNVLLMAPPLLLLLIKANRYPRVVAALAVAAGLQVILGAPFLLTHPSAYISRSFNLVRVFIHHWSVNFKFLPEAFFLGKPWAIFLLATHLLLLFAFAHYKWCRQEGGLWPAVSRRKPADLSPEHVTTLMFVGNFIGIVCARTLHYQFYSWYCQTLPYLLWRTPFPTPLRVALFFGVELCWWVFPSTSMSSICLLLLHVFILVGLCSNDWEMTASRRTR